MRRRILLRAFSRTSSQGNVGVFQVLLFSRSGVLSLRQRNHPTQPRTARLVRGEGRLPYTSIPTYIYACLHIAYVRETRGKGVNSIPFRTLHPSQSLVIFPGYSPVRRFQSGKDLGLKVSCFKFQMHDYFQSFARVSVRGRPFTKSTRPEAGRRPRTLAAPGFSKRPSVPSVPPGILYLYQRAIYRRHHRTIGSRKRSAWVLLSDHQIRV